jgi:hypothetical protein
MRCSRRPLRLSSASISDFVAGPLEMLFEREMLLEEKAEMGDEPEAP